MDASWSTEGEGREAAGRRKPMCMATAYLKRKSGKEVLLEDVAYVQQQEETSLLLKPLLGGQKQIRAKIKEIDFLNSTILLEQED
jgi:predicted RNA-binding protein